VSRILTEISQSVQRVAEDQVHRLRPLLEILGHLGQITSIGEPRSDDRALTRCQLCALQYTLDAITLLTCRQVGGERRRAGELDSERVSPICLNRLRRIQ
jgi:hypothetical protein